jgi:site-specific recombinase XerD
MSTIWRLPSSVLASLRRTRALGKLTQDYERFLSSESGLARSTVTGYLLIVRRFLTEQFEDRQLHFEELRPQDMNRFILGQAQRVSRAHAGATITALRSFLRFLRQRGAIKINLATSLFGVARSIIGFVDIALNRV